MADNSNILKVPSKAGVKTNSLKTMSKVATTSNPMIKSQLRVKSKITSTSQARMGTKSQSNFHDGADDGEWLVAKDPVKPVDQLVLTSDELKQEHTCILRADNPYAPDNIVRFSYVDREYKQTATVEQLAMHFSLEGGLVHVDSEEARRQKARESMVAGGRKRGKSASTATLEISTETSSDHAEPVARAASKASTGGGDDEEGGDAPASHGALRNQFNFSERASQSINAVMKERGVNTDPPLHANFSANALQWDIYDAYVANEERKAALVKKGKKEEVTVKKKVAVSDLEHNPTGDDTNTMWSSAARVVEYPVALKLERMVTQNIFDDVAQDFKYWEDASDEFKDGKGSLLPLWKFSAEATKKRHVTALCWSPQYADLFAAGYGSYDYAKQLGGHVCVFSLKLPSFPSVQFSTDSGVMCLDLHPKVSTLLAVGFYDGTVAVFNLAAAKPGTPMYASTAKTGKHAEPVWQINWQLDDVGSSKKCFCSISSDGRVTAWTLFSNELVYADLIQLRPPETELAAPVAPVPTLEVSAGTCFAFSKHLEHVFLVGTEDGKVHKCSKAFGNRYLATYNAHQMAVYAVVWNPFHPSVFATCGADWNVKIWDLDHADPVFSFDLGNSVGDVAFAPYSSTVFAACTADGRVYVFDLSVSKTEALCSQAIIKKAKLTHLAFNPKYPMLLIGDDHGCVTSMKLSPNLRKAIKGKKPPSAEIQLESITKILDAVNEVDAAVQIH